ncbi:MAG: hypothetical protein GY940_17175, partial [bacterium]|nr:hypothetical protein [bacterium]
MKEFFTPAKAYPINPETIAGKYSFDGEDLKKYRDFIHQLRDIYNSHYSALDKAILPDMDKDILLPLFNYHINNVGNPDGNCRYGLETHQFELQLLNEVFLYLNMKPYGREKGSNSFGYFTLGHKEAAIFSIKAAKTRFLYEDAEKIFLLAFGQVPLSVFEAAKLLDVTDISPIATDIIQLEERVQDVLNESVGTGVIFTVNVKKDSSAYDLRRLRGLIKWIRQTFPGEVHIHLTADSILDVHQLAAGRNLFIPAPSSVVYIDTLSISSTHRSHSSFLSGLLLTTVYVQEDFNRNTVPYIGSEDSTVVGSRNGSFLLLDNYFFQRFPFDRLSLLKNKNADYLSHYMKRHGLTPAQADDYAGFDQKLKRLKRQSMGYPINHLWDNSVLNDMFEMLIKEVIMNNTESGLLSSDLKLNHIMSPNGKPYVDEFRDQVLAFYREVFFPYTPDEFDGYITTGGTEGNYIGLFLAKRKFKENGVLFLTPGSHYSISKGAAIFELPTEKVDADEIYGCMMPESLENKIKKHLETNPKLGVVININLGTTIKGAVDSIAMVNEVLDECGIAEENRYIHCDA